MSEREARSRAVYDHDNEEPRPSGRRRRQVADWGVGEEIFDHMPGRRFERRPHQDIPRGDADDGRRTIVIETGDEDLPAASARTPTTDDEFASREEALRAREADDELWGGEEPFVDDRAAARPADHEAGADDRDEDTGEFVATSGGQHDTGEFAPVAGWAAAPEALDRKRRRDGVDRDEIARGGIARDGRDAIDEFDRDEFDRDAIARADGVVRGGQAGRRTVKIGGRPAEFYGPPARARQRPPRTMHERLGPRPDRVAMWAFALGLLLILIAIATANI